MVFLKEFFKKVNKKKKKKKSTDDKAYKIIQDAKS